MKNNEGYVVYRCRQCRMLYRAKDRNYKPTCSPECALTRWRASVKGMINKTGPMYAKWKARQEAGLQHRKPQPGDYHGRK